MSATPPTTRFLFSRLVLGSLLAVAAMPPAARVHAQSVERIWHPAAADFERTDFFLTRVDRAPSIDGRLDEALWADALVSDDFLVPGGEEAPNTSRLMAAYDDTHLYLAIEAFVGDPGKLVRQIPTDQRGMDVWHDDCIDFSLSPDAGVTRYQVIVNANGAFGIRAVGHNDWDPAIRAAAEVGEDGYRLEIALPLADIGLADARPPAAVRLAMGRADRSGAGLALSTVLGKEWADLSTAPRLVLGSREEWRAARAGNVFTRDVAELLLLLNREAHPRFERQATGRIVLRSVTGGEPLQGTPAIDLEIRRGEDVLWQQTIESPPGERIDFDLGIEDLPVGEYALAAVFRDGGEELASTARPLRILEREAPVSGQFTFRTPAVDDDLPAWPVTFGVPFPWGAIQDADHVRILDSEGVEIPFQAQVLARWSRTGSIRWLRVDAVLPVGADSRTYTLVYGPDVRRMEHTAVVAVDEDETHIRVGTGAIRFDIPRQGSPGLGQVYLDGPGRSAPTSLFEAAEEHGPFLLDADGVAYWGFRDPDAEVVVEARGPLRATVRVEGYHRDETGEPLGRFILRLHAWAGLPYVQMDHTFIVTADAEEAQYRAIGVALPIPSDTYAFGTPAVHTGDVPEGGAYLLQSDDLHYRVVADGRFRTEGGKSEGWVTAGRSGRRMTVAVRDFWQLFPKELEVLPDRVNVYAWPKHNLPAARHGERLSIETVPGLWFVHEGEVLDFKVPDEVIEYFARDTIAEDVGHARVANPTGTARTHHVLLYFHGAHWADARAPAHRRVFQADPTGIVDPAWVCGSGAMGPMAPRDPDRFPIEERAMDLSFQNIRRAQELDRDYGLFNFGNSHHNWQFGPRRWSLHRIWYNTHHGWNRWPWIQYARSGSPEILAWARRNSRFAADVAHANYAPERFRRAPLPRRKILGGIHDYKGLVPWNRGERLCYNSSADALFWHHYFTGDMRSLATALNHARSLLGDPDVRPGRAGSGRTTSALAAYEHTWDNDYLEFAERHLAQWFDRPPAQPANMVFAPSFERYIDLTGSRQAGDLLARWAEFILDDEPSVAGPWYDLQRRTLLAYAFRHAGDERFLQAAARRIAPLAENLYTGDDPRHYGAFVATPSPHTQSYFLQQVPYYLQAAIESGHRPDPAPMRRALIRTTVREDLDGSQRFVFRARLRHTGSGPVSLRATAVRRGGVAGLGGWLRPLAPDADPIAAEAGETVSYWAYRGRHLHWTLDAPGPMDYEIVLYGNRDFHVVAPVTEGLDDWREIYRDVSGYFLAAGSEFTFEFPGPADRMAFTYRSRGRPFQLNILDPTGQRVAGAAQIGEHESGNRWMAVHRGGRERAGWTFEVVGYSGISLERVRLSPGDPGRPFVFAVSPDKLFQPD